MKFLLSGLKKELEIGKITLADEIWIAEKFPDYYQRIASEKPDMGMVSQIVYRLLVDKSALESEVVEDFTESGEKITRAIGGVEKLTRCCSSAEDTLTLLTVFIEACNKSRPDAPKNVKKKKVFLSLIIGSLFIFSLVPIIGGLVKFFL